MTPSRLTRLESSGEIARHVHVGAYATPVLAGAYEEAGDTGRFKVAEGDVLIHAPFFAHRDIIARAIAHGVGDMVEVGAVMALAAAMPV